MASGNGTIEVTYDGEVAIIVINRPNKRNALSLAMWRAVPQALRQIRESPNVRLVVVRGQGNEAFSAGADIEELEALIDSRDHGLAYIDAIRAAEGALAAFELPTVARIRGFCVGGGLELAMACDLRLASADSRFMAPPARLGIAYSLASTRRLSVLVGESRAKELLFAANEIDAQEAWRIGLVDRIFPNDEFEQAFNATIAPILRNSQRSIRDTKTIFGAIRNGHVEDPPEVRELRVGAFNDIDFAEGVKAFRERRHAKFRWGRDNLAKRPNAEETNNEDVG